MSLTLLKRRPAGGDLVGPDFFFSLKDHIFKRHPYLHIPCGSFAFEAALLAPFLTVLHSLSCSDGARVASGILQFPGQNRTLLFTHGTLPWLGHLKMYMAGDPGWSRQAYVSVDALGYHV